MTEHRPHNIQEDCDERVAAGETSVVPSGSGRGDRHLSSSDPVARPQTTQDVEAIREALVRNGWRMKGMNKDYSLRREGLAALERLQEQLEAAQSRARQFEEWLRFYAPDDVDVDYMVANRYPARVPGEPCECGRPTSECNYSCDFCTGGFPADSRETDEQRIERVTRPGSAPAKEPQFEMGCGCTPHLGHRDDCSRHPAYGLSPAISPDSVEVHKITAEDEDRVVKAALQREDSGLGCPECGGIGQSFSRTLCACGRMHWYCNDCGAQFDACDPAKEPK